MFHLAITLDPRFSAALVNLGNLYVDAKPGKRRGVLHACAQGRRARAGRQPTGTSPADHGAVRRGARDTVERSVHATADNIRGALLRNLGKAEIAQGDSASARTHWKEASQLLPNDEELRSLLSH
jgi:hypothetical protein